MDKKIFDSAPGNYYDKSISKNVLQKFWHNSRFINISKVVGGLRAKMILDIGCHGGKFTSIIQKRLPNASFYGIDISKDAINYARKNHKKIHFLIAAGEKIPFPNEKFDLVVCLEVLEHVPDPKKVIDEAKRVLQNNGKFLILVPAENLLFQAIWKVWTIIGPGKVWKHSHIQKFKGDSLKDLLKSSEFKVLTQKKFLLGMLLLVLAEK